MLAPIPLALGLIRTWLGLNLGGLELKEFWGQDLTKIMVIPFSSAVYCISTSSPSGVKKL